GFGKTRAGAEWVWARVREVPGARIALVGGNLGEVEKVMVTGPSGLIATAGTGEKAVWSPGKRMLSLPNGARAFAYSAERPEALRGPEHHFAWCDELAKWRRADETWDNLMLGLRLGERPRTLVTTTPRPVPLLKRIKALDGLAETGGRSDENLHLPADALAAWKAAYGRTRLARQELEGVLFDDAAGSLWPRAMIEASRGSPRGAMGRVVIGVDPPASAEGVCGISVCGSGGDGCLWVLADLSAGGLRPEGWASKAAAAAGAWEADRVVAEANNGGDMVESVLRNVAPGLAVKLVHASRGKVTRAEPVASLFETGKARFAGVFPELEDELAGLVSPGGYQGPGRSPDRADAMVWALTELSEPQWPEPRIRRL
ncbi:terminase large subunit domain-containing protein, partial [Allosphingosinicella sp.]|uniref:terminase large subunit domain-containing protein n=1 Tax=Allosphingosinicella sp. TaxID=2823234 RepID=UPI002F044C81